jgi:DNA-binding MarR family transcriptional regulator
MVDDLVALCRVFGFAERDFICCGTVTVQQCGCLQALLEDSLEAKALADRLGSSPSAATRLVDGLVKQGWAERVRDTTDRRKVHVQLTGSGQTEAERLRLRTAQMVEAMLSRIPADKRAQVVESVGLIRKAAEDIQAFGLGCC